MTEDLVLNGTFDNTLFPALLIKIRDSGKTGILDVKRDNIEKRAFFQNGEPIASRSNVRRDLLGELLCRRGKISKAQLDEVILESKKQKEMNFGQILVKKGFVTPKDLYSECKYQFISILFSMFSWESGTFSFEEKEASELIPHDLPKYHVKFSKLISEGIRLIKNQDFIDSLLGDTAQMVQPGSSAIPSRDLTFKGEENPLIEALGQGKSLQSMIDETDMDSFNAKKILYALSCLGAVEIKAPAPPVEAETEIEPALSMESNEELPALSETSLSAFMSDILPEDRSEELPVFEEEAPPAARIEELGGPISGEDDLLPPHLEMPTEEELLDVSQKIDFAVEEAAAETPAEEVGETAMEEVEEKQEFLTIEEESEVPEPDEPMFKKTDQAVEEQIEHFPAEEEEVLANTIEEKTEEAWPGEETVLEEEPEPAPEPVMEEETLPPEQEEVLLEAIEKDQEEAGTAEEEEDLPPEQEESPEEAVEEKAEEGEPEEEPEDEIEEPAVLAKEEVKKKKSLPLVLASVFMGVLVLFGGLALFYFLKARESKVMVVADQVQEEAVAEEEEIKSPEEILQELAQAEQGEKPREAPSPTAEGMKSEVPVPETAETPVPKDKTAEPKARTAEVEEKAPTPVPEAKEGEGAAVREPALPWKELYVKGLADFREGNLKSALKSWSDVVRAAPDQAYSLQIEITSYLNYASKDIQEASRTEAVFIVNTIFKDKPAYKVLCGIYDDRLKAEEALKKLTPYLKAQNPALVRVGRLKTKLVD